MATVLSSETEKPLLAEPIPADNPEITPSQGLADESQISTNDRFMLYLLLFVFGVLGAAILLDLL
jgi:hypothetical protein